jgi:hypothetical protein
MIELVRVQNEHYPTTQNGYRTHKFTYHTPDGRWHVDKHLHLCGGPGYQITDTTGEITDTPHSFPTLADVKTFIAEWSV